MWYYFARSILLANDANSLQALLESLAELVREEPHVALCKSVVIQFAQERRAECPELWTPPVAAAFGQLLQTMTAAYSSPHDNVAVTKEWTSVLEQVVNFETSSDIICDALEDLALLIVENPQAVRHPFFKQLMIATLVPLKKASPPEVWDQAVAECYRDILLMMIRNEKTGTPMPSPVETGSHSRDGEKHQQGHQQPVVAGGFVHGQPQRHSSHPPAQQPHQQAGHRSLPQNSVVSSQSGSTASTSNHYASASAPTFDLYAQPAWGSGTAPSAPRYEPLVAEPGYSVPSTVVDSLHPMRELHNRQHNQHTNGNDSPAEVRSHLQGEHSSQKKEDTRDSQSEGESGFSGDHQRDPSPATISTDTDTAEGGVEVAQIGQVAQEAARVSDSASPGEDVGAASTSEEPEVPWASAERDLKDSLGFFQKQDKLLSRIQMVLAGETPEQKAMRAQRKRERDERRRQRAEQRAQKAKVQASRIASRKKRLADKASRRRGGPAATSSTRSHDEKGHQMLDGDELLDGQ